MQLLARPANRDEVAVVEVGEGLEEHLRWQLVKGFHHREVDE